MASAEPEIVPVRAERSEEASASHTSLGSSRMAAARSMSSISLVPPVTPFDAPTATELRIGESPYPTIEGSAHSLDPFGLNAFLLHPEDSMWSYLHLDPAAPLKGQGMVAVAPAQPSLPTSASAPATLRSSSSRTPTSKLSNNTSVAEPEAIDEHAAREADQVERIQPQSEERPLAQSRSRSTNRLSGLLNKALKRRKSENSLLAVKQLGHVVKPEEQGNGRHSSNLSPKLLDNGTLLLPSTSKPTTPASDISDLPSLSSSSSSPVPSATAKQSRPTPSTGSSASSSKSDKSGSDGIVTPADRDSLGLSILTVEDLQATHAKLSTRAAEQDAEDALILEMPEPKPAAGKDRTSGGKTSSAGWKGWLVSGGKKQASKVVEVKPTVLNIDMAPAPGLSADPTAGILPSSISPTSAAAHTSELHLPVDRLMSLPAPVRHLCKMSFAKMDALRLPSSHPIIPERNLPRCLTPGYKSNPAAVPLRFPRSANPLCRPGEGLGPAESGMRIDIGIKRLLARVDSAQLEDFEDIRDMVLRRHKTVHPAAKRTRDPGISLFAERPPFEERFEVINSDGRSSPVESAGDRAVYEIDLSHGIVALAQAEKERALRNMHQAARRPGQRWNSLDLSQQRKGRPPIIVEESEPGSARSTPSPHTRSSSSDAVPRTIARRQSTNDLDLPPSAPMRNKSSPDLSTLNPRRLSTLRTVNTTWEESSSESEEEEEDDVPLSTLRKPAMSPATATRPVSWAPTGGVRPSLPVVNNRKSMMSVSSGPALRRAPPPISAEEDYRALVAKARERRQEARSGETERRAGAQALVAQEAQKRQSRPSGPDQRHSLSAPASPAQRKDGQSLRSESRDSLGRSSGRPTAYRVSTSSASSALQACVCSPPARLTHRSLSHHDLMQHAAASGMDPRASMIFPSINTMMPMVPAPLLSPTGMFMPMGYPQIMVPATGYIPMQPVMIPAAMPTGTTTHHNRAHQRGRGGPTSPADSARQLTTKTRQRSPVR